MIFPGFWCGPILMWFLFEASTCRHGYVELEAGMTGTSKFKWYKKLRTSTLGHANMDLQACRHTCTCKHSDMDMQKCSYRHGKNQTNGTTWLGTSRWAWQELACPRLHMRLALPANPCLHVDVSNKNHFQIKELVKILEKSSSCWCPPHPLWLWLGHLCECSCKKLVTKSLPKDQSSIKKGWLMKWCLGQMVKVQSLFHKERFQPFPSSILSVSLVVAPWQLARFETLPVLARAQIEPKAHYTNKLVDNTVRVGC